MRFNQFKFYYLYIVFVLQICFICCTTGLTTAEIPPLEQPLQPNKTYTTLQINSTASSDIPIEFPTNNSTYKIIYSTIILKTLISNSSKIDTEVPDLMNPIHHKHVQQNDVKVINKTEESGETRNDPELDAEMIENDVSKTEDVRLKNFGENHGEHGHVSRIGGPVAQGQMAAILAAIFALVAVVAYIGLLLWRRYLEFRYGNREMLINEEEYINYNDMKNFEL